MINFGEDYSREFIRTLNVVINEIFSDFMDIGSNLEYEEIYGTVFPEHKRDDLVSGMHVLKTLNKYIRDGHYHNLSALYEYVLYNALYFVYESSDDGFNLDRIISNQLTMDTIRKIDDEEAVKLFENIHTPFDVIGIIFEDVDFLQIGEIFDIFRKQPEVVTNFLHIDLDYYEELMPEDIRTEYKAIKGGNAVPQLDKVKEYDNKQFKQVVIDVVQSFKHIIEHKKGYIFLNNSENKRNEKQVQRFFDIFANAYLKNDNIIVNPEVDLGRGFVDFYLSIGKKYKALIELKLGSHREFENGIDYQLPTYLMMEKVEFGILVLICYSREEYDNSKKLFENAKELSTEYEKDIRFVRIDASRTLKSPSKIKHKIEMGFED